ncbi:MAG: hypothetical protein NVS1B11_35930 [Terriglobales bacterium]
MVLKLSAMVIAVGLLLGSVSSAQTEAPSEARLLTPSSAKVHRLLDQVWDLAVDQVEQEKATTILRKAVEDDPNFAIAHEILAQVSLNPAERVTEQRKAYSTKSHASPGEQKIVDWFQNAADHKLIPAITDMNDVLRQYPHDRWVVYLAIKWLTAQTQYERAAEVYENSKISNSPGLLNNAAYTYAYMRQFDKAFTLMDKYIAALPENANPQDSYAEMLRMAGHFDEAIDHYKTALILNPDFYSSQFGIADTYSLMGDQVRARREYESAFRKFSLPELDRIVWKTREAITYVRDGDLTSADQAFQAIADDARVKHMSQVEADTYRQMAMYERRPKQSFLFLSKAMNALREGNNMTRAAVQEEQAQILRTRVELAAKTGDKQTTDATLAQLAKLSNTSEDKLIEAAYHGAAGTALFSRHHYKEAILHLDEDTNNPLSLRLLALAYRNTGYATEAKRTSDTLATLNDPTLEQAMTVPAYRKCLENSSCDSIKTVSYKH